MHSWRKPLQDRSAFQVIVVCVEVIGDQDVAFSLGDEVDRFEGLEGACQIRYSSTEDEAFAPFDQFDEFLPVQQDQVGPGRSTPKVGSDPFDLSILSIMDCLDDAIILRFRHVVPLNVRL